MRGTVSNSSVDECSITLDWNDLVAGNIPDGSFHGILLRDGLPVAVSDGTIKMIHDSLDWRGTLRVLLPPDLAILEQITTRFAAESLDLIETRRGEATFSVRFDKEDLGTKTQGIDAGQRKVALVSDRDLNPTELSEFQAGCGVGVEVVQSDKNDDVLAGSSVLYVPSEVLPEARWLRPLLAAHFESERPTGCRLRNSNGTLLHVGGDGSGAPWGNGFKTSNDLLEVRRNAELLPPFIVKPDNLREVVSLTGDLLADVDAQAKTGDQLRQSHRAIGEVFGRSLLVVSDEDGLMALLDRNDDLRYEPGDWIKKQQADGFVVAISVEETFDPWLCTELGRFGVLLNNESERVVVSELAKVLQPTRISFTSNLRLENDFQSLSFSAQDAAFEWIGKEQCARIERIDSDFTNVRAGFNFVSDIQVIEPVEAQQDLISIVIPVYGMWDLTRRCLESIALHTNNPYEIIVVDDCSPDDTLKNLANLDVRIVRNEQNLGFPSSVNRGIAASRGEFVCVLNNDTEVTDGWLSEMLLSLKRQNVALVGPRSNAITGRQSVPRAPSLSDPDRAHLWAKNWSKRRLDTSWPSNTLIGFCLLSRRNLYEQLGGFEQGFGHGNFEDLELSLRVREAGYQLHVADGSVVLHHGSASFDGAGIDLGALMSRTYRRFGDRDIYSGGLLTAVVLSDSGGKAAQLAAASATSAADKTIILERGCLFEAELMASAGANFGVSCEFLDWADSELLGEFFESIDSDWIIVMHDHEELVVNEWGRARAELASREGDIVALRSPEGVKNRVHRPLAKAIEVIGCLGTDPMRRLLLKKAKS